MILEGYISENMSANNTGKKKNNINGKAVERNFQSINPRNLVLSTLEKINREDCYSNIAIKQTLDDNSNVETRDKALIKRLVEGCIERQIELDYIIGKFSKTSVNKLKPVIREILRMAIYQIVYMDNIPDSAACNEAVKLTTKRGFVNLKGYVNGVLRSVSRSKVILDADNGCMADNKTNDGLGNNETECIVGTNIAYPSKLTDGVNEYLSIKYSTPKWLIDMWIQEQGLERTQAILEAFLQERPVCLRLKAVDSKPVKISDETMTKLSAITIGESSLNEILAIKNSEKEETAVKHQAIDHSTDLQGYSYELASGIVPTALKEFEEGLLTVQDPASVLAVLKAGIRPGDTVIDVCAAPGGKSIFAGELTGRQGLVQGFDLSDKKIPLMNQNKLRMKGDNVTFAVGDATLFNPDLENKADVVICDVPCSGLGVIGKKRDIKYKANEERIRGLLPIQRDILNNVCKYVKPGGRLCYSTCTISKRENENQVDIFLEVNSEFTLIEMLQLLPDKGKNDGFFIAVMEKKSNND